MENLRKKNQMETLKVKNYLNQTKNTRESHCSRLEEEDRISGLENKIDVKEKKKTLRHKTQKLQKDYASTQQLHQKIKPMNHGLEEGEEVQAKGICNIFNKIIAEIFPNLEKELSSQVQEVFRKPNRLNQNRTSQWHIIVKTTNTENREILKAVREKEQIP
jgi:hypothetical protein